MEIQDLFQFWELIIINLILNGNKGIVVTAALINATWWSLLVVQEDRSQSNLALLAMSSNLGRHLCFQRSVSPVEDIGSVQHRRPRRSQVSSCFQPTVAMVQTCSAYGCKNRYDKDRDISFHKYVNFNDGCTSYRQRDMLALPCPALSSAMTGAACGAFAGCDSRHKVGSRYLILVSVPSLMLIPVQSGNLKQC